MEDKWEWDELAAAIDSGSVDHVVNPRRFWGHRVTETENSKNGGHWKCAGGTEIKKRGMIKLPWVTEAGTKKRMELMVGDVGRTLLSVDRLEADGYDTYLTKNNPRIVDRRTGETIRVNKKGGLFTIKMWVKTKRV